MNCGTGALGKAPVPEEYKCCFRSAGIVPGKHHFQKEG